MTRFVSGVLFLFTALFVNNLSTNEILLESLNDSELKAAAISQELVLKYRSVLERRNIIKREIKNVDQFWENRTKLAELEVKQLLGNDLLLNPIELEANNILLQKKYKGYNNSSYDFPPSIDLYRSRSEAEEPEIFSIIKKIPKGAHIYGWLLTSIDLDYMYRLTFNDHLYFRFEDKLYLKYSISRPGPGWRSLSYLRNTTHNPEYIDDLNKAVKSSLAMVTENNTISIQKISEALSVRSDLVRYKPNFMKILTRILEKLYEENVLYAELNFSFPELYDLKGNTYNPVSVLRLCKVAIDNFKRNYRRFIDLRFVYSIDYPLNSSNINVFKETAIALWKANPVSIVGFSILTDKAPLSDFVSDLLKLPKGMRFSLATTLSHDWGTNTDYNILDALVLAVDSIVEASPIYKHPFVLEELRKRNVPIKFSPILAKALNLVGDVRGHPLSVLVATNYPLVIGNVGSALLDATDLSYDWYEFFMGLTPRFCDLRCLKQLAINSWLYSGLPLEDKKKMIFVWERHWNTFINYLVRNEI